MVSTLENILRDLKNKIYQPLYLLYGDEPFYVDTISDNIEAHVLDEMSKEFNQTILYGRDIDVLTLLSTAKRYPMMSDYQVVIVKEAQDIKDLDKEEFGDGGGKRGKEARENPFFHYMQNPLKSTILVLCYKYKNVDKRKKFYKVFEKNGVVFESKKLYDNEIPGWAARYLKVKDYNIKAEAAELLVEYLGNDLSKISNELDKLMLNVKPGTEINATHIEENIGISKEFNVFELQDAIGSKNYLKANRIVNYFAANPKSNPMVLIMANLYSYFSKLLHYQTLADKSKANAAALVGFNSFFIDKYTRAAKNYPAAKLIESVALLREYDVKSKGVGNASTEDGELLKEMIYRIMH